MHASCRKVTEGTEEMREIERERDDTERRDLVPAESPVGRHSRVADDVPVLLNDVRGRGPREDVQVDLSCVCISCEIVRGQKYRK